MLNSSCPTGGSVLDLSIYAKVICMSCDFELCNRNLVRTV